MRGGLNTQARRCIQLSHLTMYEASILFWNKFRRNEVQIGSFGFV